MCRDSGRAPVMPRRCAGGCPVCIVLPSCCWSSAFRTAVGSPLRDRPRTTALATDVHSPVATLRRHVQDVEDHGLACGAALSGRQRRRAGRRPARGRPRSTRGPAAPAQWPRRRTAVCRPRTGPGCPSRPNRRLRVVVDVAAVVGHCVRVGQHPTADLRVVLPLARQQRAEADRVPERRPLSDHEAAALDVHAAVGDVPVDQVHAVRMPDAVGHAVDLVVRRRDKGRTAPTGGPA